MKRDPPRDDGDVPHDEIAGNDLTGNSSASGSYTFTIVPEPTTWWLISVSIGMLVARGVVSAMQLG